MWCAPCSGRRAAAAPLYKARLGPPFLTVKGCPSHYRTREVTKIMKQALALFPLAIASAIAGNHGSNNSAMSSSGASVLVAQAQSAAPVAASSAPPRDKSGPGGDDPTNMLMRAAYDLSLSDAQKSTLDRLHAQLESNEAQTGGPFKDLKADLVAGIRIGTIDAAKLKRDEAAIDKAMQAHIATEADVLNGLHAALNPLQRKAVVDDGRAKQTAHAGGPMRGGQMAAHGADSKSAQDWTKRRLERITSDLGLDAAQQKQVAAMFAKEDGHSTTPGIKAPSDERQKRMDALLTAFQKDSFDANKLVTPMGGKRPHHFASQEVAFVSQLLLILKADQRENLAMSIDKPWMRELPEATAGAR